MSRRPNLSNWYILAVDDDALSLALVRDVLARYKAKVYTATSGADALALLRGMPRPTVILCDVLMPEMDGFALLEALRADNALLSVPVIAVTAQAMPAERERILAAGFDGYISKPFSVLTFVHDLIAFGIRHERLIGDRQSMILEELLKEIEKLTVDDKVEMIKRLTQSVERERPDLLPKAG